MTDAREEAAGRRSPDAAPARAAVLSHRGRTRLVSDPARTDNSEAALAAAFEGGADGAEVDVRLAACGTPVLVHDRLLPDGRPVAALTRAELAEALGPVATLDGVLDRWPDRLFDVELKVEAAVPAVVRALQARPAARVLVTSFLHEVARAVGREAGVPFGYVVGHRPRDLPALARTAADDGATTLVCHGEHLEAPVVAAARAAGLATWVHGLVTAEEHRAAIDLGVAAVVADDLALALAARETHR